MLFNWCKNHEDNIVSKILTLPAAALNFVALLSKLILSALLIIPSLPIIAIVHAISSFFAKKYFKKALTLEVELVSRNGNDQCEKMTLENALDIIQKKHGYATSSAVLDDYMIHTSEDRPFLVQKFIHDSGPDLFYIPSDQKNDALEAVLHLNLFQLTEKLEKNKNQMILK